MNIILFLVLFGVLVFIHELGHFLVAKFFNVYVERFAVGMGPKLIGKRVGETEYQLALLPLGGYVKMLGDEPGKQLSAEEAKRSFLGQHPLNRILIVLAGPVTNLVFPVFLFMLIFMVGVPRLDTQVGTVSSGSPADQGGFQVGDRILAVNGGTVRQWTAVDERIKAHPGQGLVFLVARDGREQELNVVPEARELPNKFGEIVRQGYLGISNQFVKPNVVVPNNSSPAGTAGLATGDVITAVCGTRLFSYDQIGLHIRNCPENAAVTVEAEGKTVTLPASVREKALSEIGIFSETARIDEIESNGPAAKAGIKVGDLVVEVNGEAVTRWTDISDRIQAAAEEEITMGVLRGGESVTLTVRPEKTDDFHPVLGKNSPVDPQQRFKIGIRNLSKAFDISMTTEQYLNPLQAFVRGLNETLHLAWLTLVGLYKLFTGKVSIQMLGGPIMIYNLAGHSFEAAGGGLSGLISFGNTMALLSITLGIINLIPIPVLDGGHILFYTIEAIRRRPLSQRVVEVATQFGFVLLMGLIVLVFYNDIMRYGFFDGLFNLFK